MVEQGWPWSFDGDGDLFRLVSEALRIHLAHLFDSALAVHTSLVEPLPHQITAVYQAMLPRQPLRFLLADDPGAGKTIMTGLLMKELIARGDLQRCLVVCPGSLAEQWQDELYRRFHLGFEILTNDKLAAARTGNWFLESDLAIARLDKLARDGALQEKLQAPDCRWDLVVCDEAHKMSATFTGGEVRYTKRYHLGQLLAGLTRHFLLLTATPHNGKEEDFQLFMALLDGDRFEGRFRDGVHVADISDLMRRMVKERLLTFDGTPLFPVAMLLRVMWDTWNEVFRDILGRSDRSLVSELREHRNKWAHQQPFSSDDAYRALDSAHRLLTSISAPQVRELDAFKQELRRRDRRIPRSGGVLPPHLPHRQPVERHAVDDRVGVAVLAQVGPRFEARPALAELWRSPPVVRAPRSPAVHLPGRRRRVDGAVLGGEVVRGEDASVRPLHRQGVADVAGAVSGQRVSPPGDGVVAQDHFLRQVPAPAAIAAQHGAHSHGVPPVAARAQDASVAQLQQMRRIAPDPGLQGV